MAADARLRGWSRPGGGWVRRSWTRAAPGRAARVHALGFSDTALWGQGSGLGPQSLVGRRPRPRRCSLLPFLLQICPVSFASWGLGLGFRICASHPRPWQRSASQRGRLFPRPSLERRRSRRAALVSRLPFFGGGTFSPGPGSSLFPTHGPRPQQGRHQPRPAGRFGPPGYRRAHSALLWWGRWR